jgi:DNA primase
VAITEKHIGRLKRLTKNLVFALDADAAGEEAMLRCVGYENNIDNEVKVIIMPPGQDPDEVIKNDKEQWPRLLEQAIPIMDFTFDMVAVGLDLTKASDKTLAASKLLPIIKQINNVIRQAHYMQKLARLIGVDMRTLEAALGSTPIAQQRSAADRDKPAPISVASVSSPLEEYCLALLLQHPELRSYRKQIPAEYFAGSVNRELFATLVTAEDTTAARDGLDGSLVDHLERLAGKELPANNIEPKLVDCISRLKLLYLKGLERKREAILSSEADASAQIDKLKEQGIEPVNQLREVFQQRSEMAHKRGSVNGTR